MINYHVEIIDGSFASNAAQHTHPETQCQEKSQWRQAISLLAGHLQTHRSAGLARDRNAARERFYELFRSLSLSAARRNLHAQGWEGDLYHDAEEITHGCIEALLRQEMDGRGVFQAGSRNPSELRGYLSRTIWNGVWQHARDMRCKNARLWRQLPLATENALLPEEWIADAKASDASLRVDLKAACDKIGDEERDSQRFEAGMTPLAGVFDNEIARAVEKEIPKRTWQRYVAQSRKDLMAELEM